MCDYSLMMIRNRLAVQGEELVAHRFKSGTTGLVSLLDFNHWKTQQPKRLWQRITACFSPPTEPAQVVCIPPGARLRLKAIPVCLRDEFGLGPCEDATFTQISAEEYQHRDALLFGNSSRMVLQSLPEGQMVTVLRLSSAETAAPEPELASVA